MKGDISLTLKHISGLLFINNFVGQPITHLWSVAVEVQFYLVSPFILTKIENLKMPIILIFISTVLNFLILFLGCEDFADNRIEGVDDNSCYTRFYEVFIYI